MYWYVRKENRIEGPFPAGQIQQSLLLGRLQLHDEVSTDKDEWLIVQQCPELIPDVLKDNHADPAHQQKLEAARRWADERRGERREDEDPGRLGPGRREQEPLATQEYRAYREQQQKSRRQRKERTLVGLFLVVFLTGAALAVAFLYPNPEPQAAQCAAAPAAGINWQHCQLSGIELRQVNLQRALLLNANLMQARLLNVQLQNADLAYVDLTAGSLHGSRLDKARLTGSNLQSADLSAVSFKGADLSYANLRSANIEGADFTGAKLKNAVWVDGRVCNSQSVGRCQ